MKQIISVLMIIACLFSLTGCATTNPDGSPNTGNSAGLGAMIGAVGGAVLGYAITGKAGGALAGAAIGAAAGGLTGFIVGKERERTYKTADQIYKEKPELTNESAKNDPPKLAYFKACIFDDQTNQELTTVGNGSTVVLGSEYELDIPQYSSVDEIEVTEYNTLVAPNGKKMDQPGLTRKMMRKCTVISGGVPVTIPKGQPSGYYTHVAMIKIGDKWYKNTQQIVVAKANGLTKIYAANRAIK